MQKYDPGNPTIMPGNRSTKNKTDNAQTTEHIRARDLIAFGAGIVVPMKPFSGPQGSPGRGRQPQV